MRWFKGGPLAESGKWLLVGGSVVCLSARNPQILRAVFPSSPDVFDGK